MRALLYKDWILTWKYSKLLLLPVLLFSIAAGHQPEMTFFGVYAPIVLSALSLNSLAYDEKSGWLEYADALPYERHAIVRSKFLLSLLGCLVGILLPVLCTIGFQLGRTSLDLKNLGIMALAMLVAGTINSVVMLPVSFRFGTNTGRIIYIVLLACMFAFGSRITVTSFPGVSFPVLFLTVAAGCLILWVVSFLVSLKLYQPRRT